MVDYATALEKITNPPPKVQLMYGAVAEFIHEKRNIGTLKVEDITKRAGIGKGTAYEYFSSKEELISYALLFEYSKRFATLVEGVAAREGFQAKFECILEWIYDNSAYHMMFTKIIRLISYNVQEGEAEIKLHVSEELLEGLRDSMRTLICDYMKLGLEEGVIKQEDERKRLIAFLTAIVEYNLSLGVSKEKCPFALEDDKMREFVYESMVKALN